MAGRKQAIADLGGYLAKIARTYARDYGVKVMMTSAGTPAQVDLDRKIIYLPCDIDMAGPKLRQTIEGLLDHEAGHCRAEVDFKGEERYSVFHKRAGRESRIKQRLLNIFEDARQEQVSKKRWVGVKRNLDVKNDVLFTKGESVFTEGLESETPPDDIEIVTWGLNKKLRTGEWPDCMTEKANKIAGELEDILERAEHMWCPRDADRLANEVHLRLADLADPPDPPAPPMPSPESSPDDSEPDDDEDAAEIPVPVPPDKDEDEDEPGDDEEEEKDSDADDKEDEGDADEDEDEDDGAGSSGEDSDEDSDEEGAGDDSEDEEEEGDEGSPGEEEEEEDDEEESDGEGEESDDDSEDEEEEGGSPDDADGPDGGAPSKPDPELEELAAKMLDKLNDDERSPEEEAWANINHELAAVRSDADTYHLVHPEAARKDRIVKQRKAPRRYAEALEKARPAISVLVRRLTLWLRAQVPTLMTDQIEGDIDEETLVYISTGERRIFETELPGLQLDTAFEILIDQSGSMGSGTHSRSYWTRVAGIAFGEALHRCRIPFEMWGWDTDEHRGAHPDKIHTRVGNQRYFQYKTFDEHWPRIRQRTGRIDGHIENDDVDAIYFGARRLVMRKERHKILLVLTDGQPAHSGIRAWPGGWRKRQLQEALRCVRRVGITDIGVGIQCDYVKDIYDNHIIVKDLSTFARDLIGLLRKTVRGG